MSESGLFNTAARAVPAKAKAAAPKAIEPTPLEQLDAAYDYASANAADPKAQSAFREAFQAYRAEVLQPTKGAKA